MAIIDKFLVGPATATVHQVGTYLQSAENVLDFGADGFNVAAGDEVLIVKLPNEAVVSKVTMEVTTGEGLTATINVGDFVDPDGWHLAYDVETAGTDTLQIGTGDYSPYENNTGGTQGSGRRYIGGLIQDTINMIPSVDLNNCKIWFSVEYYVREQFTNNS